MLHAGMSQAEPLLGLIYLWSYLEAWKGTPKRRNCKALTQMQTCSCFVACFLQMLSSACAIIDTISTQCLMTELQSQHASHVLTCVYALITFAMHTDLS